MAADSGLSSSSCIVDIEVANTNDNTPIIPRDQAHELSPHPVFSVQIEEESEHVGTLVYTVLAYDADGDEMSFSITGWLRRFLSVQLRKCLKKILKF